MKVHEYQAKEILARAGVPVPKGFVASTPEEARKHTEALGGKAVVKAQVHAGGRGKAGGIKLVNSPQEAEAAANALLGKNLVTHQTGPQGVPIRKVLIEEQMQPAQELYVAIIIDRQTQSPVVIASAAGGMEIEEVAAKTPEKIKRQTVEPVVGLQQYQGRELAYGIGLSGQLVRPFAALVGALYNVFTANDCSLAEINPLSVTKDGRLLALDAKLNFEDDALFRHPDVQKLRDPEQEDPLEARAAQSDVSYVTLDGDVGCLVNGAGLAMATMDVIKNAGFMPANFLDVGGGADVEKATAAVDIILSDPKVKRVLINVFGGILRCDNAAQGVVNAYRNHNARFPLVVRMLGTNAEEGKRILSESGLPVTFAEDLDEAAKKLKALA